MRPVFFSPDVHASQSVVFPTDEGCNRPPEDLSWNVLVWGWKMKALLSIASLIVLLVTFGSFSAEARWKTHDEADTETFGEKIEINVHRDGTYTYYRKWNIRILTKNGISQYATYDFNYDADSTKLEKISAFVINGDKRIAVDKKYIEDKPVSSGTAGFNSEHRVMIAFPEISVGSVLSIEEKRNVVHRPVEGHFFFRKYYGYQMTKKGQTLVVNSELPLRYLISGAEDHVDVRRSGKRLEFTLNRDVYFSETDERAPFESWSGTQIQPLVQISSEESWNTLVQRMLPRIKSLMDAPLPMELAKPLEMARKANGLLAQANVLHTFILQDFRYMGDWRVTENGYYPRSLAEIIKNKFGDCKDFSYLLAIMLKNLGYKVELAGIERGDPEFVPMQLPTVSYFNHMVVRAEDKNGSVYWLDPTNSVAFSGGKWPDIADRPAMVLRDSGKDPIERTPKIVPSDRIVEFDVSQKVRSASESDLKATFYLSDVHSASLFPTLKKRSEKQRVELLEKIFSEGRRILSSKVLLPDVSGDVVRPLRFTVDMSVFEQLTWTSAGYGKLISGDLEKYLNIKPESMVLGLNLSEPETFIHRTRLDAGNFIGSTPSNCTVSSPWMTSTRTYELINGALIVETRTERATQYISIAELRSPEFRKLQEDIRKCLSPRMMILKI